MVRLNASISSPHDPPHGLGVHDVTTRFVDDGNRVIFGTAPLVAPCKHGSENGNEVPAFLCQPVLVTHRSILILDSSHNPHVDKRRQAVRQDVTSSAKARLKIIEAADSEECISDDRTVSIEQSRELSKRWGVPLHETSGLGHNGVLTSTDVFDSVITFTAVAEWTPAFQICNPGL